jgi:membrane protease YdiL (CAAX protease family)
MTPDPDRPADPYRPRPDPGLGNGPSPEELPFADEIDIPVVVPVGGPGEGLGPTRRLSRPPRPGFLEAFLWCLAFLLVLHGGSVVFAVVAWVATGVMSGNFGQFAEAEQAGLQAAAQALRDGRPPDLPAGLSDALVWGMVLGQAVAVLFVWLLLRVRVGRDWRRQVALRRPAPVHLLLAVVATPGLMILHGGVHELIHAAAGKPMTNEMAESLRSLFARHPWPLAVLVVGLLPGVLEELFCRGFLGRGLVGRYGLVAGVVLTSVLFGLLHVLPLYALGTMAIGLALHFTYVVSRSLWVPILIHALNNSVTILATVGVIDAKALDQNAAQLGPVVYLASAAGVVFAFVAMWTGRAGLRPADPGAPAWQPPFPGVVFPPPGANAVVEASRPSPAAVVLAVAATGALVYLLAR